MAEVTYTQDQPVQGMSNFTRVQWSGLTLNDTGTPYTRAEFADRSIQVTGTFGAGGIVVLEGTNDGTNYSVLTDPQGNNISITTAKIEAVSEIVVAVRPRVSGGDGTTNIVVTMLARKN